MPSLTRAPDRLLEQATDIAREAAIGETTVEPVLVALPDAGPPVPLFIETDEALTRVCGRWAYFGLIWLGLIRPVIEAR